MKSAKRPYPTAPKTPRPRNIGALEKDALQVYCRLRPANSNVCIRMVSSTTICAIPPEATSGTTAYRNAIKESQFMFKEVFSSESTQQNVFETIAQPLLEGLVQGRNGLLFAYGVTGSGKTYTMLGDKKCGGIMPRCIQILFKTIGNHQAEKYVFKPDKLNGFEMQTDVDADFDRRDDLRRVRSKLGVGSSTESLASLSESDIYPLPGFVDQNIYSVFITFVEIYNNGVYDLLDDGNTKSIQVKIIREDYMHNMFVHGVTEVEVKSPADAMALFHKGRKRKRTAYTDLNAESSRSHSVFTIRLVQAPMTSANVTKNQITISQLSLVDLAGSERSNRTKNTGARLKEASKINNSLLNLRICLEILRENYTTGGNRMVPYRDSKLTHLFKMFFEGGGYVRMIVCVNPRVNDYEETIQVCKFAEISQEVQIARPTPMRVEVERNHKRIEVETPRTVKGVKCITDRKRARQLIPTNYVESEDGDVIDYGLVYNLGDLPKMFGDLTNFPNLQKQAGDLYLSLTQRLAKRGKLVKDLKIRQDKFRAKCNEYDLHYLTSAAETNSYKATFEQNNERIRNLESNIVELEKERDELHAKIENKDEQNYQLQCELNEKRLQINATLMDKENQKKKFDNKLIKNQEKLYNEFESKLREQRENMKQKIKEKEAKICKIVLDDDISSVADFNEDRRNDPSGSSSARVLSNVQLKYLEQPSTSRKYDYNNMGSEGNERRHRRSRSVGCPGDKWLEHRAGIVTDLPTAFKPQINRVKTITQLGTAKNLTKTTVNKYCLLTQEPDTDGEIETRLLKGDVIPTTGGGAQVVFSDMEVLRQESPTYHRKRSYPTTPSAELTTRCSVGIEGHNNSNSKRNKN